MKNLRLLFIPIFALATFSCKRDDVQQNGVLVTINATQQSSPDVKTNIGAPGTTTVTWSATDNIGIFDGTVINENVPFNYSTGALTNTATFSGTINDWLPATQKTFNAFYPYDIANSEQAYDNFTFLIPISQTQNFIAGVPQYNHLGLYDFMAASPASVTRVGAEQPEINFAFRHLMAILDIEITNSTGSQVTVTKIVVRKAVGDFSYRAQLDLSKAPGDVGFFSYDPDWTVNQLQLVITNASATADGEKFTGSMIFAPVNLTGYTDFIVTAGGVEYLVTKSAGINLEAGKRYKAPITIVSSTFTDSRDNKVYKTVNFGGQIWMAENLNYATASGSWCYDANSSNCTTYGKLYDWATATADTHGNGTDVCPYGWHLPTDAEWTTLTNNLGGESVAGGKLKETGTTHWNIPNDGATNSIGFKALPAGYRYSDGNFYNIGNHAKFWTATEEGAQYAFDRCLYIDDGTVYINSEYRTVSLSVRCVKNN